MKHTFKAKFNAWALDMLDAYMHSSYGKMKHSMVADHPEVVLEVGAGTGSNLKYFRGGTKVIAIEPSGAMQDRLREEAGKYDIDLHLVATGIEEADIEENSIDFVVTTLVLCTVPNLERALSKIHRVLRPGGRYVFLEHVAT
ncbi:MAG: class I SAM-dependent methyltransferase [Bacteroidetes bacterium]|nr:class I SAM-dependent methyltransferase [Bacteroidota bacterium]